jgi:hypothetical protein
LHLEHPTLESGLINPSFPFVFLSSGAIYDSTPSAVTHDASAPSLPSSLPASSSSPVREVYIPGGRGAGAAPGPSSAAASVRSTDGGSSSKRSRLLFAASSTTSKQGGRKMKRGASAASQNGGVAATCEAVRSVISMLQGEEDHAKAKKNAASPDRSAIATNSAELKAGWEAAQAEAAYTMNLKEQYDRIKGEYAFGEIARMFPQFICFFPRGALSTKQKERFSARYNDWNASRGLPLRLNLTVDDDEEDSE